jgi:hypothetical protein
MHNEYLYAGDIVYILTKNNHRILIDLEDFKKVDNAVKNYLYVHLSGKVYYATYYVDGRRKPLHRLIMDTPDDLMVDHINHNGLDNRKENLRNCTAKVNSNNARKSHEISLEPVREVIFPKWKRNPEKLKEETK